jgi:preprotein translocase subunit SecY
MLSAYANSMKIPELRKRIFFTFGVIALCRLACNIPCPGVDPKELDALFRAMSSSGAGGVMDVFNLFSGGALQKFAVAALGIMPYISASIIVQLMTPVIPALEKMMREGDSGRQKITQYTRYLAVIICIIQGSALAKGMANPAGMGLPGGANPVANPDWLFMLTTVSVLTCGAMLLMWLGEQIDRFGIGNGASLIITVNIVARMPQALYGMLKLILAGGEGSGQNFTIIHGLLLVAVFFAVCAATVALIQGHRKIPVRHANRSGGRAASAGQTSYMPLRVNYSGVMPIIFASAVLMFPPILLRLIPYTQSWTRFFSYGSPWYMSFYALAILLFSFFWVANQFNPIQISDDLQKRGGYVPGIRPGQPTAEFLDYTMTRITLAGSLFLVALAVFPMIMARQFNIPSLVAQFFGGTSLLIIAGVMLDTMRQVEAHLLSRHYDGFMKKGHLRSRRRM